MSVEATATTRRDWCPFHDHFEARRIGDSDRWTSCPACWNTQARARITTSGLPAKYDDAEIDNSTPPAARQWACDVLKNETTGPLILVGPVGVGKTHTACAVLRLALWRQQLSGAYVAAGEYGRRVRDTWSRGGEETESTILRRHARAGLLVLDELGAHREVDTPMLQDLIAARYDADLMHRLIVISNFSATKFDELVGERAADRLREGAVLVPMKGASRRKPAGAPNVQ